MVSCTAPPPVNSPQFLPTFPLRSQSWFGQNINSRTPFAINHIRVGEPTPKTCLLADALDWRLAEMEARLELQPSQAPAQRSCLQEPPLKPHAQVHLLSPIDKCKVSASHSLSLLNRLLTKRMLRCATSRQRSMFTTVPCPASPAEHSSGEQPPVCEHCARYKAREPGGNKVSLEAAAAYLLPS